MVYGSGTIKVVWITDGELIYSKMFNSVEPALEFAKQKNDFLVFQLEEERRMEDFVWRLLPYGHAKLYQKLIKHRQKAIKVLESLL